jgi:hypothetical protein
MKKLRHLKSKYFFFGNFAIAFEFLTKGIYITRTKNGKVRQDNLFGLIRMFHRESGQYIWSLHFYKFGIRWFLKRGVK